MPETLEAPAVEAEVENADNYYTVIPDDDEDPEVAEALGLNAEETPAEDAAAAEAPAAEPPAAVETPAVETPAAAEIDADTKAAAEFGRQWKEAFARDPAGAMQRIISSAMTEDQKAALITAIGGKYERAADLRLPEGYSPESELEKVLIPQLDWVTKGQGAVREALMRRDEDIRLTYAYAVAAQQTNAAIAEAVGLKLPAFDADAVLKHFAGNPDGSLDDAIGKVYGEALKAAVAAKKQSETPRPDTPRSAAAAAPAAGVKPKRTRSLMEAYAATLAEE